MKSNIMFLYLMFLYLMLFIINFFLEVLFFFLFFFYFFFYFFFIEFLLVNAVRVQYLDGFELFICFVICLVYLYMSRKNFKTKLIIFFVLFAILILIISLFMLIDLLIFRFDFLINWFFFTFILCFFFIYIFFLWVNVLFFNKIFKLSFNQLNNFVKYLSLDIFVKELIILFSRLLYRKSILEVIKLKEHNMILKKKEVELDQQIKREINLNKLINLRMQYNKLKSDILIYDCIEHRILTSVSSILNSIRSFFLFIVSSVFILLFKWIKVLNIYAGYNFCFEFMMRVVKIVYIHIFNFLSTQTDQIIVLLQFYIMIDIITLLTVYLFVGVFFSLVIIYLYKFLKVIFIFFKNFVYYKQRLLEKIKNFLKRY